MYRIFSPGYIEVITGPMFSGKSEELIKRIKTLGYANAKTLVVKPSLDDRWKKDMIISRAGGSIETISAISATEILKHIDESYKAVAIDEAQFFKEDLLDVVTKLANKGIRIIVSCLDTDFAGQPFGQAPQLLAIAEFVTKLHAVCFVCGNAASMTYRKSSSNEVVMIGDDEYEARCRKCHQDGLASK